MQIARHDTSTKSKKIPPKLWHIFRLRMDPDVGRNWATRNEQARTFDRNAAEIWVNKLSNNDIKQSSV